MNAATLRLVLLVSCAHALVHIYELSLPAAEQLIGREYAVPTSVTGSLGTVWRIPFGLGAIVAGWLADRFGSKRLLIVYLLGCAATSLAAWQAPNLGVIFAVMLAMGCFASIYHPAGLALISHETDPVNRGKALGWHGILGSLGIAGGPMLAGLAFQTGTLTWRSYYLLLSVPGAVLAACLVLFLRDGNRRWTQVTSTPRDPSAAPAVEDDPARWRAFFLLVAAGTVSGFVYAALMHFLPRYLDEVPWLWHTSDPASRRNLYAGLVLLMGMLGQGLAGRWCRPHRLEWMLTLVFLANVPLLVWMAYAQGIMRLAATGTLMLVHFMNQPVYNSLIAQYVPRARRSLGYGFSNMMCFGLGALGPAAAGYVLYAGGSSHRALWTYLGLAGAMAAAGGLAAILWQRSAASRNT